MVFVLVSELLIYDYNNYSIVVHCECDGNLDVCCAITSCLGGRSVVAML